MSQPEGLMDDDMQNGELQIEDEMDNKIHDQVLTVKQCRKPLAG